MKTEVRQIVRVISIPSTEDVLGQLDADIAMFANEDKAGGWNAWVLVGAFVAQLVLIADVWEAAGVTNVATVFWFMASVLFTDGVLAWLIPGAGPLFNIKTAQERPGSDFRRRRPVFVAITLKCLVMIALSITTGEQLDQKQPGFLFLIVANMYGFVALRILLAVGVSSDSRTKIPDFVGRGAFTRVVGLFNISDRFFAVCISGVAASLAAAYVAAAGFPEFGTQISDSLRMGVLLSSTMFTVLWLLEVIYGPSTVADLQAIRRQLSYGQVDALEAMVRAMSVVEGIPYKGGESRQDRTRPQKNRPV